MPAVGPNSLILVTGASGFVAAHCVSELLERGHSVRGTVRSEEKGQHLKELFKRHGDKFSYVIAADLEHPGVFDESVKGVDGVLHTASPFHFNTEGQALAKLIKPALRGTENVLSSIAKEPNVKRVVVTSSYAAIIESSQKLPYTFTEKDWNTSDPKKSEEDGDQQNPLSAYRASKALAERAAWDFVEAHQPSFDLATINPPLVLGPPIHQVDSPEKLNTSAANVWKLLHGGKPVNGAAVDVRDVAKAHAEALVRADAGGQRFAPSIGTYTWQQVADHIRQTKVDIPQAWRDGTTKDVGDSLPQATLSGEKAHKELGIQYHTLEQSIDDSLRSFLDYEKRGWKGVASEEIVYLK